MRFGTIIILAFIACACKKNEDPTGPLVTLLTFTGQPNSVFNSSSDHWVFVSDEEGRVLDTKSYKAGQTVTLSSNRILPSGKINITVFEYASNYTSLNSYLAIPVGQSWTYMPPTANSFPQAAGTAKLVITNFPAGGSLGDFTFTDDDGNGLGMSSADLSSGTYTIQLLVNKAPSRIYAATFRNGVPVTLALNNVTSGSTIQADFNTDFKPLDHSLNLNLSGSNTVQAYVIGLTGKGKPSTYGGNVIYAWNYKTVTGPLAIGYNDGFDSYRTVVATMGAGSVLRNYIKIGAVPASAPLLNYKLSVANEDVRDFSFSLSGNFHLRYSMWIGFSPTTTRSWYVYSPPDGKQKLPNLPQEIKDKYPNVRAEDFTYNSNIFTLFLDGFTYDDYIKQGISGPWSRGSTESQSIQMK